MLIRPSRPKLAPALGAFLILAAVAGIQPAYASTYRFSVTEGQLESILSAKIGPNNALYGFYDIYIRPTTSTDSIYGLNAGNQLTSYTTPSLDISPIQTGPDAWTAST